MATTTPDNIYYPAGGDSIVPLQTTFATQAASVQNALNAVRNGATPIVADAAARNAIFPSPVQGNAVYRSDLGYVERFYSSWNASTNPGGMYTAGWQRDGGDSGWVTIPNRSGISGTQQGRIVGQIVTIRGNVTGSFPKNSATAKNLNGALSELWRPSANMWGSVYGGSGYAGVVVMRADGSLSIWNRSASTWSSAQYSITYTKGS